MSSPSFARAAAAVAGAALLAAVPLPSRSADPFEINVILPLTGAVAFLGQKEKESLDVIETVVNKAGGIQGRPMKFVYYDDQSSPPVERAARQSDHRDEAVPVDLGVVVRLARAARRRRWSRTAGRCMYCFSPGIYPKAGSYEFSAQHGDDRSARDDGALLSAEGLEKSRDDHLDRRLRPGRRTAGQRRIRLGPENKDMEIVDREHFNTTDISVAAQMAHIKQSGAQAMVAWVSGNAFATILHGTQDAGLDIPVDDLDREPALQAARRLQRLHPRQRPLPGLARATRFRCFPAAACGTRSTTYLNAMKAAGVRPDQGDTLAWDAAQLVIDGYKKYGFDMSAAQLREYLSTLKGWTGINGSYDFAAVPQRGLGSRWVIMVRWDKSKGDWTAVSAPGGAPLPS